MSQKACYRQLSWNLAAIRRKVLLHDEKLAADKSLVSIRCRAMGNDRVNCIVTKRNLMLGSFLAVFCSISAWAQISATQVKGAYQTTTKLLDSHCAKDDFGSDDLASRGRCFMGLNDDSSAAFLDEEWSLASKWSSIYLNQHPLATADEVQAALKELDPDIQANVVELANRTFLIFVSRHDIGNVFIVTTVGKSYKTVWNIEDASSRGPLAAWSIKASLANCKEPDSEDEDQQGACGPMAGAAIVALPDDYMGNARFYIDAFYASTYGEHVFRVGSPAQLSIWKWDGHEARPLVAHAYRALEETKFENDILTIRERAYWKALSTCGACAGRAVEWSIRIGREGVENLGKTGTMPELDVIDELYDRVDHKLSITDLAAPAVANFIRESVDELRETAREAEALNESDESRNTALKATEGKENKNAEEDPNSHTGQGTNTPTTESANTTKEDNLYLGMIGGCYMEREGYVTKLCLTADEIGPHLFTLKKLDGGRFYVSSVQELGFTGPDGSKDPCDHGGPDEVTVCRIAGEPQEDPKE